MAIYRFEGRIIRRADSLLGRSIVACAAYRAGERLRDEKYNATPDYRNRTAGVAHSEIFAPLNAPSWATDREKLWNAVEAKEDTSTRRKTAQLAREFIAALPHELTPEQRKDLMVGFVNAELVSRGMIVDLSIHQPKEGLNHHAHLLCSMRDIDQLGFDKKNREWNDDVLFEGWREAWEIHTNNALEAAGRPERVDRRSLADRGIDRAPEPKIGVAAKAMERKGMESERGKLARWAKMETYIQPIMRSFEKIGEVAQYGIGATWWERAQVALEWGADQGRELLRDTSSAGPMLSWQDYISSRAQKLPDRGSEIEPNR